MNRQKNNKVNVKIKSSKNKNIHRIMCKLFSIPSSKKKYTI